MRRQRPDGHVVLLVRGRPRLAGEEAEQRRRGAGEVPLLGVRGRRGRGDAGQGGAVGREAAEGEVFDYAGDEGGAEGNGGGGGVEEEGGEGLRDG